MQQPHAMPELLDVFVNRFKKEWEGYRRNMDPKDPETTELYELVEQYLLIRQMDDRIGFAALNLLHTRQAKGALRELLDEFCETYAEVKEVRRLDIQ